MVKHSLIIMAVLCASCIHALAGYTHYFTWKQPPDTGAVQRCVADMNRLIEARKDILVSPDVEGAKVGLLKLEALKVDFNGAGTNACEPFVFPGEPGFNFCKTGYESYDEVVTACLIAARDYFPPSVLKISSDGSWPDWSDGANLYSRVLKRIPRDPTHEPPGILGTAILIGSGLFICGVFLLLRKFSRGV